MDVGRGGGFRKFMERRSTRCARKYEQPPQGRTNYAPLELLSRVALEQLRRTQDLEKTFRQVRNVSLLQTSPPLADRRREKSTLFSPNSLSSFQTQLQDDLTDDQSQSSKSFAKQSSPSDTYRTHGGTYQTPTASDHDTLGHEHGDDNGSDNQDGRSIDPNLSFTRNRRRCLSSRFCHICSRTTRRVSNISCKNYSIGTCRKVICEKCFCDYGWDWAAAVSHPMEWSCTHCRNICPSRAQCSVYRRTNERRRENQQRLRMASSVRMMTVEEYYKKSEPEKFMVGKDRGSNLSASLASNLTQCEEPGLVDDNSEAPNNDNFRCKK